jgi:uncharacterized membrane protein
MFVLTLCFEVAVIGGLLLIQPYVVRRGLLFGVYVGEERSSGPDARVITRQWLNGMLLGMAAGVALAFLVVGTGLGPAPAGLLASVLTLLVTSYAVYLRAYFQARRLAVPGIPAAAAPLLAESPYSLLLPLLSVLVAIACGTVAIAYAWLHFDSMPGIVPTHFGPSGRADAWSPRSFQSVMLLPIMTLLLPTALGIAACLTARAKRALRRADGGVSLGAQLRFRRFTASYLSGVVVLVALMLCSLSIYGVRAALGASSGIPPWMMAFVILILVYAVGGAVYVALRLGQGGARLERQVAGAPLTNGVADNSHWYLGGFYVNRDDPSIFVEKRFGIGYTINFGNPTAVVLFAVFLAIVLGVVISGLVMPQTHTPPAAGR